MSKYEDGLTDGQQVKTYMDFRKIRAYIESYVDGLDISFEDEGTVQRIPNKQFAEELAKVITNRYNAPK